MEQSDWLTVCRCGLCGQLAHQPRLLPCYHTFCTKCLDDFIYNQRQNTNAVASSHVISEMECPECGVTITLPKLQTRKTEENADAEKIDDGAEKHQSGSIASGFKSDIFVDTLTHLEYVLREDKKCDRCTRMDDAQPDAQPGVSWCMHCFDVLCQTCLKSHSYGKTTSDHRVLPLTQLRQMSVDAILKESTAHVICPQHDTEVIKMYCLNCRTSVCVQCLAEKHRGCDSCVPLQMALDREERGVAEMMFKLSNLRADDVIDGADEGESGAAVLEKSVVRAQDAIRKLSLDLRKKIEDKERELIDRLHTISSQLQEKVGDFSVSRKSRSADLATLTSASNRMDAMLKYGTSLDILDLFTSMQTIMTRVDNSPFMNHVSSSESNLKGSTSSPLSSTSSLYDNNVDNSTNDNEDDVRLKVNFQPNPTVKSFLQNFENIGEIFIDDFKSDEGISAWGVCVTSRDDVIVVDCRNKKVQKFGINGELIDHIQISEEPRDVTTCGEVEVAMTVMKKQIYILAVSQSMALKRRIKTQKQYDAISVAMKLPNPHVSSSSTSSLSSFISSTSTTSTNLSSPTSTTAPIVSSDDCSFLVSCLEERCVDVISAQGDILLSFGTLTDGSSVFESPRYVTHSHDGHYIVSDCHKNTVSCITQDGGLLFSYHPSGPHSIQGAQGVCCDASGNLFVADFKHNRVHLLNSSGEFQRFVLGRDSRLSRPVAMSISNSNKLVIVQSDGMVKIFGYESMKVKLKGSCWCPRCLTNMEGEREKKNKGTSPSTEGGSTSRRSTRSSDSVFSLKGSSPLSSPKSPKYPVFSP